MWPGWRFACQSGHTLTRTRRGGVGYNEYLLAQVWTNCRGAISHEIALADYDLADILPMRVHFTALHPYLATARTGSTHGGTPLLGTRVTRTERRR